ncbi:hypothetical protein HLH33_13665 [Gluconacetobacter diazotrophicus]|uniref:Uncharacterized protein n=1 Tax=Gluconacetobacter diazotrophicus TaxID=33996 RepID=A0A7W4NGI7_GLUDI|nr:hypothetical protein [Gluconacetobacter diazotrophicus]MBB2157347.1 hypothetical protein [Gluconacetobacter diazotrophicus]
MSLHIFAQGLPDPGAPARSVASRQFESLAELEALAGVTDRAAFWRRFFVYPEETRLVRGQGELERLVRERIRNGEVPPTETERERTLRALRQSARGFLEPSQPDVAPYPQVLDALASAADAARAAGASPTEIIDASEGLEH